MTRDEMRKAWRERLESVTGSYGFPSNFKMPEYFEAALSTMFDVLAEEIDRRLPQEPPVNEHHRRSRRAR